MEPACFTQDIFYEDTFLTNKTELSEVAVLKNQNVCLHTPYKEKLTKTVFNSIITKNAIHN